MRNTRDYMNQYQRQRRRKAVSGGLCIQCTCRPATSGFTSCEVCRNRSRVSMLRKGRVTPGNELPSQPVTCPICESIPDRFYWHHWEDSHPELGMWVCPYCNIIVELEDKGLVGRYKKLKDDITYKYNNTVLKNTLH